MQHPLPALVLPHAAKWPHHQHAASCGHILTCTMAKTSASCLLSSLSYCTTSEEGETRKVILGILDCPLVLVSWLAGYTKITQMLAGYLLTGHQFWGRIYFVLFSVTLSVALSKCKHQPFLFVTRVLSANLSLSSPVFNVFCGGVRKCHPLRYASFPLTPTQLKLLLVLEVLTKHPWVPLDHLSLKVWLSCKLCCLCTPQLHT